MPERKPIAHKAIQAAIEHYRQEKGYDPREAHPALDGDEPMPGLNLIVAGLPPEEEGVALPFARRVTNDKRDPTERWRS